MFKNINLIKSIIAILLVFIPLYPKFPLFNVPNTYVAIRLDDIVVALAVSIWFIYQISLGFPFLKQKITKLFFLYFLAIFVSFIHAYLIYQTEPVNILLLHLFRRFEYMSLFFITLDAVKSFTDFKFIYYFFLVATSLISFYGYGQKYLHFPVISTMNSEFSKGQLLQMNIWTRISSTFAGHYDLAAFLSVALIIIFTVFLLTKNRFTKIISLLVWLPSYHILTLTASRISIFAFLGGVCLTLIFIKKYFWIIPITSLVVFSIFNSNDLNQRLIATIPALKNQFNQTGQTIETPKPTIIPTPTLISKLTPTPKQVIKPTPTVIRHQLETYPPVDADVGIARSGEIRFNAEWPRAITAWHRNLLVGSGLGSITLATDNDYLRCLGESGLLGLITFSAIMLYFIVKTVPIVFKKSKTNYDMISLICLGGLITTLANAIFIDVFEASKTAYLFWIMLGCYHQSLNIKHKNDSKK